MTKKGKIIEKNEKKFFWNFFRYDVIQERAWFFTYFHLFSKKMVFSSKHNMEITKSEKLLKKTKKKFSEIFFDMTSSKKERSLGLS